MYLDDGESTGASSDCRVYQHRGNVTFKTNPEYLAEHKQISVQDMCKRKPEKSLFDWRMSWRVTLRTIGSGEKKIGPHELLYEASDISASQGHGFDVGAYDVPISHRDDMGDPIPNVQYSACQLLLALQMDTMFAELKSTELPACALEDLHDHPDDPN